MLTAGETVTNHQTTGIIDRTPAEQALAELIVSSLQLEVAPEEIEPEARLFGEGLGLDSIDALELALAISRTYGFELRSDDERNERIFASLRSLSNHVEAHRTK
jgi:acyl carrier protein